MLGRSVSPVAMALCAAVAVAVAVLTIDLRAPPADVLTLDRASASFSADAPETHGEARPVRLPQNWTMDLPPTIRGSEGTLAGVYRFEFEGADFPDTRASLLIARVSQGVRVEFNGRPLFDHEGLDPQEIWDWYTPLRIDLPRGLVLAADNHLELTVLAKSGGLGGLSRLHVGPRADIAAMEQRLLLLQKTLPMLANLAVLMMAVPLLLVWLHGRNVGEGPFGDYGVLAAAAAIFAVRSMHVHVGIMPLTHPFWLPLVGASLGWAMAFFYVFLLRSVGIRSKVLERSLALATTLGTLMLFVMPQNRFVELLGLLWYLPMAAVGVGCVAVVIFRTAIAPDRDRVLLSISLCVLAPAGVHDALWARGAVSFEALLWMPMVMPAVLLAITGNMANGFVRAWVGLRSLNQQLVQRVEAARSEIAEAYDRRLAAERREVAASERARLIEDLHDGVGGRLAALVATLRAGQLPAERTTAIVRDCLDDLHMVITARDVGPLGDAIADLQSHQSRLLEARGISLSRSVDPAIAGLRLGPQETLNVLRIAQEAISNAARHSDADAIHVACRPADGEGLEISIRDNGATGPVDDVPSTGRGLDTMQARAARLGGTLAIERAATGWTVTAAVPLPAAHTPRDRAHEEETAVPPTRRGQPRPEDVGLSSHGNSIALPNARG